MKPNFGSNIVLQKERTGTKKYLKYKWVASATEEYPNTIFIHKDDMFWLKLGDKRMIRNLRRILAHESIHNILWYMKIYGSLDYIVEKFKKQLKKDCKKTWKELGVI